MTREKLFEVPLRKQCTAPGCAEFGGWVFRRRAKGEPKTWLAASPGDLDRLCYLHGPGAFAVEPGKRSGELLALVARWNDGARLERAAGLLESARLALPDVRRHLDEVVAAALVGQGGGGAGVADPTGAAALRVGSAAGRHRQLSAAIAAVERSVAALVRTAEYCLTEVVDEDEVVDEPKVKPNTCPVMVLRVETDHPTRGSVKVRCGANTAHKTGKQGEPVDWDPDGYCLAHRAEADARLRGAEQELAEAIVSTPVVVDRRRRLPTIHQMLDNPQYPPRSELIGLHPTEERP